MQHTARPSHCSGVTGGCMDEVLMSTIRNSAQSIQSALYDPVTFSFEF